MGDDVEELTLSRGSCSGQSGTNHQKRPGDDQFWWGKLSDLPYQAHHNEVTEFCLKAMN